MATPRRFRAGLRADKLLLDGAFQAPICVAANAGVPIRRDQDFVLLGCAQAAAVTLTLPTAVGIKGRVYTAKKIDSSGNVVTLDGCASETIDGVACIRLSNQWCWATVISDGTNWQRIG